VGTAQHFHGSGQGNGNPAIDQAASEMGDRRPLPVSQYAELRASPRARRTALPAVPLWTARARAMARTSPASKSEHSAIGACTAHHGRCSFIGSHDPRPTTHGQPPIPNRQSPSQRIARFRNQQASRPPLQIPADRGLSGSGMPNRADVKGITITYMPRVAELKSWLPRHPRAEPVRSSQTVQISL
jgi:hypothetical protein